MDSRDLEARVHPTCPGKPCIPHPHTLYPDPSSLLILKFIHLCFCVRSALCIPGLYHLLDLMNSYSALHPGSNVTFSQKPFLTSNTDTCRFTFSFFVLLHFAFIAIVIVIPHYILAICLLKNYDPL